MFVLILRQIKNYKVQLRERGGSFIPKNCDGKQPQYLMHNLLKNFFFFLFAVIN